MDERLAKGDSGINGLDRACKQHDIAYSMYRNRKGRREADAILAEEAWGRVFSTKSTTNERFTALAVAGTMKAKSIFG